VDRVPAQESALLQMYLVDRDVPCPSCGYNLRNLAGEVCPECGEGIALRVNVLEPRQAAPLAGLVTLSAGAGLNGLLLIYVIIQMMRRRGPPGLWLNRFVVVNLAGLFVLGVCVWLWLKFWPRIRRLDARRRWLLVFACALLTLSDVIIFTKVID
jgi:hypothetical protein